MDPYSRQSRQSQSFREGDAKRRVFKKKMAELPKDIDPYGVFGLIISDELFYPEMKFTKGCIESNTYHGNLGDIQNKIKTCYTV